MTEKQRPSVLIIDDDHDYLEILKRGLKSEFDIITIENFESLKKESQAKPPSLIMLDKHLGTSKPEDVITYIQSQHFFQDVPIFMVSGNETGRKIAADFNLEGFMIKPASFQGIREMFYSALNAASSKAGKNL